MALVVKNMFANAEDVRDMGLIPGSRRSPGEENWQPAPVSLPGKSHGLEEPGGLQSMGLKRVTNTHIYV